MKTMLKPILLLVMLVPTAVYVGGASTPTRSGYLDDYAHLRPGRHLDEYWVNSDAIVKSGSAKIVIGEINTNMIKNKKGVTVAQCSEWLKSGLTHSRLFSESATGATAKIDLAITFMDPGSASARIWAGELGAGHAKVQIEGRITDIRSGKLLATFADRGDSSGGLGLKDLKGDAGPALIQHMIRKTAEAIDQEFSLYFR